MRYEWNGGGAFVPNSERPYPGVEVGLALNSAPGLKKGSATRPRPLTRGVEGVSVSPDAFSAADVGVARAAAAAERAIIIS